MRSRNYRKRTARTQSLHRIKQARETAGITLRSVARQMRTTVTKLKKQESTSDLRLSELYRWQKALKVPIIELLEDPVDLLSEPIRQRACLIRVARTVNSLLKKADSPVSDRLTRMLINQLQELMPELKRIGAWPEYGQRRSGEEMGPTAYRIVQTDNVSSDPLDTDGPSQ